MRSRHQNFEITSAERSPKVGEGEQPTCRSQLDIELKSTQWISRWRVGGGGGGRGALNGGGRLSKESLEGAEKKLAMDSSSRALRDGWRRSGQLGKGDGRIGTRQGHSKFVHSAFDTWSILIGSPSQSRICVSYSSSQPSNIHPTVEWLAEWAFLWADPGRWLSQRPRLRG